MYKTEEIRIRDPYVVVKDGAYYMYRSVDESVIVVHKSRDLALWEEAVTVCTLTEDSWGTKDLWAPEVHPYAEESDLKEINKGEKSCIL